MPQSPKVALERFSTAKSKHKVLGNPYCQSCVMALNTSTEVLPRFDYYEFAGSLPHLTIQDALEADEKRMEPVDSGSSFPQDQTGSDSREYGNDKTSPIENCQQASVTSGQANR